MRPHGSSVSEDFSTHLPLGSCTSPRLIKFIKPSAAHGGRSAAANLAASPAQSFLLPPPPCYQCTLPSHYFPPLASPHACLPASLSSFSHPVLRNSVHMSGSMMTPAPFLGGPAQASEPEPGLWFSAHRRPFPCMVTSPPTPSSRQPDGWARE